MRLSYLRRLVIDYILLLVRRKIGNAKRQTRFDEVAKANLLMSAQIIKFLQVFVSYWTRHTVLGSPGVGRFLLRPTEAGREKLEGLPVLPDCRDARLASSS